MEKETKKQIPANETGKRTDIEDSCEFDSAIEAVDFFEQCTHRLLNISQWEKLCGNGSANFRLTDEFGNETFRTEASVGDHFKIDIPGPGTVSGQGYDWVRVEKIVRNGSGDDPVQSVIVQVRPATNPQNDTPDVAHFFTDEATSSFVVERNVNIVSAAVRGRNEVPNNDAEGVADKARNVLIALGALAGLSEVQWKKLVHGILNK